jgi:IclR family KDG regulon transcriptional repressor
MPSERIVNSITRGADILRCLSEGMDRITDLSGRLRLSKSTIHRFLKSLEMSSLVMRDPVSRRYYLGPLILDLASNPIVSHQHLTVCAFEDMKYLRDLTGETVVLHIRIGPERICLEELQSFENIRYTAGKGFVAPLYTGSAGKILLSELNDAELHVLLENLHLTPVGPNTITDKKVLLKELEKVRKQGFATSFGERIQGSASISVPIRKYVSPVALSVLGPDNRFSLDRMMKVLGEIRQSASRISKKLEINEKGKVK